MRLALLLLLLLAAPAGADTVTRSLEARDAREARALALLLAGLSLGDHLEDGGSAGDWAEDNVDALLDPDAEWAQVRQKGEGHEAAVSQAGGGNTLLLLQLGAGAVADLHQDGGDGAVVVQWGSPQP